MTGKRAEAISVIGVAGHWLSGTGVVLVLVMLVLFFGWVIISENRTRHLAMLIRALRGRARSRSEPHPRRARAER